MDHEPQILSQIESGDPSAAQQLLPLVYDELRKRIAHPEIPSRSEDLLEFDEVVQSDR